MGNRQVKTRDLPRRRRVRIGLLALGLLVGLAGIAAYLYHRHQTTKHLRVQAEKALDRQDLTVAAAHLRSYLDADPASADGHFLLAQTLRRSGKYVEAERELDEAKQLGYKPPAVKREAYLAWIQRRGVREQPGVELIAMARSPNADWPLLESLYRGDLASRNWDRAGLWLHLWLERYPNDWAPLLWQADLLERFKKYDRARADYLRVLELRPDDPRPLLKVGLIALDNRGDYAEAETYLTRSLEVDPGNVAAEVGLARCFFAQGKQSEARTRVLAILAGNPRHGAAALLLGTLEAEAGRDEEAVQWLLVAEAAGADPLGVNYQLDQVLRRLSRTKEAEKYSRRFTELRDAHRAIEVATRASEREPDNADLQYELGRLFLVIGERDSAANWFLGVLKKNPAHRPSHAALAEFFSHDPDPDAASMSEFHRHQAQSVPGPMSGRP